MKRGACRVVRNRIKAASMKILTIGFTKSSAEKFFSRLKQSGAQRVIDVRLNNVSQLAGFAKKNDLSYFLKELCAVEYVHLPQLAPTQEMLDGYRAGPDNWDKYQRTFLALLAGRKVEKSISKDLLTDSCLLCSEATPHQCHRRLVAEYLQQKWGDVDIVHL
jgi:uncharacterized protein (DUF488 family)